jgi:Lipoxygenase
MAHEQHDRHIQGMQERTPWMMAPYAWIEALLTPRRWACGLERATTGCLRLLTFDTTALRRFLMACTGNVLTPLREGVLARSERLRPLDWYIRQFVWSALWASIVVLRLRPKKPPLPRREHTIHVISAPASYPDFQSQNLVVPDSIPCAEASVLADIGVPFLHLLQDLYPINTSYQPLAATEPQQRLRQVYPLLYRLVRHPPVWHPDLVQAAKDNRLLAALAVGGPFAKLLERVADSNRYVIDLKHMAAYPVRQGLCRLGCAIHFVDSGGNLELSHVEYAGEAMAPGAERWELIERIALCSLTTHVTVWRHGMQYHVGGLAPVAVLTFNMPLDHPIRRLLTPHIWETISTNFHTHLTLRRSGFDVTGFSFSYATILRYYDDGAKAFDLATLDVRLDAARRKIPERLTYPYLPQALRYYALFESYVRDYVDHYYPTDTHLQRDRAAHVWFDTLDRYFLQGIRGYVPELNKENLIRFCTLFMYAVTVEHEDNTLWNYAVFLPTTVRQDGRGQSVGEVQLTMNFQLLIASATNRLMQDMTFLALDDGAAAIMRKFQARLADLQKEMEAEPSRYWQIYPQDLEASVSA